MSQKLHLIYIPGLGDRRVKGQQIAVNTWRWWGVEAELFQMSWADKEPWQPKFERLLNRIDSLTTAGKSVGLVGASAGASAAINAYAVRQDKIIGCVLIAGKVNRADNVREHYFIDNPAFKTSIHDCQKALANLGQEQRRKILSLYALADETVYKADSRIDGAHNKMVLSVGHAFTIAIRITFGAPRFIRFLKDAQVITETPAT